MHAANMLEGCGPSPLLPPFKILNKNSNYFLGDPSQIFRIWLKMPNKFLNNAKLIYMSFNQYHIVFKSQDRKRFASGALILVLPFKIFAVTSNASVSNQFISKLPTMPVAKELRFWNLIID
jgi:hypothetical protein